MTIIQTIILGIVEGVTEFLPISSTFHLIWASTLLKISQSDFQKMFEVVIQAGAIAAVVWLYLPSLKSDKETVKKIIVAFIPTAIVGFVLYKLIKNFFFNSSVLQLIVFALVGILFIVFEASRKHTPLSKSLADISYKQAFWIGLAQSLAVIPGVSRAGAVMLAVMYLGVKRDEAARFSFLLAVPTILAAAALDLLKSNPGSLAGSEITMLIIGLVVSFIAAFICIKWLIRFLQTHTLAAFGWYRLALVAIIALVWAMHLG